MKKTIYKSDQWGISMIAFTPCGIPLFCTKENVYRYVDNKLESIFCFPDGSTPLMETAVNIPRTQDNRWFNAPIYTTGTIVFSYTVYNEGKASTTIVGTEETGTIVWEKSFLNLCGVQLCVSHTGILFLLAIDELQICQLISIGPNGEIISIVETGIPSENRSVLFPLNQSVLFCYIDENQINILQISMDGNQKIHPVHKSKNPGLANNKPQLYFQQSDKDQFYLIVDEGIELPVYIFELKELDAIELKKTFMRSSPKSGCYAIRPLFVPAKGREYYWLHTGEVNMNDKTVKHSLQKVFWDVSKQSEIFSIEDAPRHKLGPAGVPPIITADGVVITLWSTPFNKTSMGIFANKSWRFIPVPNALNISNFNSEVYVIRAWKTGIVIEIFTVKKL